MKHSLSVYSRFAALRMSLYHQQKKNSRRFFFLQQNMDIEIAFYDFCLKCNWPTLRRFIPASHKKKLRFAAIVEL